MNQPIFQPRRCILDLVWASEHLRPRARRVRQFCRTGAHRLFRALFLQGFSPHRCPSDKEPDLVPRGLCGKSSIGAGRYRFNWCGATHRKDYNQRKRIFNGSRVHRDPFSTGGVHIQGKWPMTLSHVSLLTISLLFA